MDRDQLDVLKTKLHKDSFLINQTLFSKVIPRNILHGLLPSKCFENKP